MAQNLKTRLLRGIGANAFGQVVTVIIQLVSVPIFIRFWGVDLYGEWLILSAIPSYFALSDIGFGSVAGNEMTMRVAQDDRIEALSVFQSTWLLITGISLSIALSIAATIWFIPLEHWLNLTHLNHQSVAGIILLLTLHVLITQQGGILNSGFRCEGNYAVGALYYSLVRLFEFSAISIAVSLGATPLIAALVFLCLRAIMTLVMGWDLHKRSPWIIFGYAHARLDVIKRLAAPAIAFLSFPLGQALSLQGMVIAIGAILGATPVVLFATLRTLSRFILQLVAMFNTAIWPELSTAFGAQNLDLVRKLHHRSCQTALWLSLFAATGLAIFGGQILKIWTGGKVVLDVPLFNILLGVAVANSVWGTSQMVPMAINQHQKVALRYIFSTVISLLIAIILMPDWGLRGAAASLLIIDLLMAVHVIKYSLFLVQDKLINFLVIIFTPPQIHRKSLRNL